MKPRSDSVLKTLHPKRQLQVWQWLTGDPENDTPPLSQKAVSARIKEEWGLKASPGALSEFYAWYPFRQELQEAKGFKDEIAEYLRENPDLDLDSEQVSKLGQVIYEKRAIKAQDPKLYIALRRLRQKDRDQAANEKKMLAAEADKIEVAMQAFYQEVRGNDEATELLDRVKALVRKQMDR